MFLPLVSFNFVSSYYFFFVLSVTFLPFSVRTDSMHIVSSDVCCLSGVRKFSSACQSAFCYVLKYVTNYMTYFDTLRCCT